MPTKMATCCREKAVLVAVYVERPSKRKPSPNIHHHHLHLHKHGGDHGGRGGGKGYNRKAELLNYSRRLRDSAQTVPSSPLLHDHHPKPTSSSHNQQSITQIMGVQSKQKHARGPACLGSWEILIPSFLRSFTIMSQSKKEKKNKKIKKNTTSAESTSTKAKAIMKSFQGKKEGFVSKVFAAIQKHR